MEKQIENRKYLSLVFTNQNGVIVPNLSKCPANPEQVMAALQFLSPGYCFKVAIEDNPIDFFQEVNL